MDSDSTHRQRTRRVMVGDVPIGGGAPVSIQSMTLASPVDLAASRAEIQKLADAGVEIVRTAVPNEAAADNLAALVEHAPVPLVADIHFNFQLAIKAAEAGVAKLRLNPGNIGDAKRVRSVVEAARERGIPIRIGVNAGSLERELLAEFGRPTAEAMVESARRHVRILEDEGFDDIVISLKASHVPLMIDAYRLAAQQFDYPLHLGVTEAGTPRAGNIKSAIGIGTLLAEGIGDTIRVSLSADPVEEVHAARTILEALDLRRESIRIVACPGCGRLQVDLIRLAEAVEERTRDIRKPLTVAVMGCAVNGPGEAREADIGIAGGKGEGLLYVRGEMVRKVPEDRIVDALIELIDEVEPDPDRAARDAAAMTWTPDWENGTQPS
ncbi:MAG: flavodoxin-dependent (E)-4-hydroxy-3-methylbut-2-enyl-diphosphate synthase [Gemmatimonadetes bacterium]|nr:flavodoxin-dependent (E)-4-hydroxy-3-methylbut-2-enyl-diphosphate synthase [Gemmatimonadota bacterium]NIO30408.1 flavodoxin-dependent (E)-4-hydroxy-3-methylbut-2-enyl-diphosphate synthase [Gemmatimonadota bacterium]